MASTLLLDFKPIELLVFHHVTHFLYNNKEKPLLDNFTQEIIITLKIHQNSSFQYRTNWNM